MPCVLRKSIGRKIKLVFKAIRGSKDPEFQAAETLSSHQTSLARRG